MEFQQLRTEDVPNSSMNNVPVCMCVFVCVYKQHGDYFIPNAANKQNEENKTCSLEFMMLLLSAHAL